MSQESRDARRAAYKEQFPQEAVQQELAQKITALETTKPIPDQFASPEEHEEALNYWMQTRGRDIARLRAHVRALSPAVEVTDLKPNTPITTG